ncbi:MAG TPA: D-2-hydroxyacid dehydrogenase family protein [Burkholderiales bacterium]|nr:D-2-hydroxyacid dehydrogenase family protein [Burkholderiales bacterium]
MNITVLDDYANIVRTLSCVTLLGDHGLAVYTDCERSIDTLADRLKHTDALVLLRERTQVSAELIARLPRLKIITLNGPYPHVDVEACSARGIMLCSEHARTSYATAELTWGLVIAAMRHIPQQMARLKNGQWQNRAGTGLRGRTLGIYGYGRIGKQVAGFGKAFGMKVLVWSRDKARGAAHADGYDVATSREALFDEADVLSIHIRLLPETRGLVTAADLARMKPDAVFVNTSRAELVADGALVTSLRAGRPGSAAIDVYENEPLTNANHPLLQLDNVIATPHLGYMERDQMENYFSDQFKRVLAYAAGKPYGVVNPAALEVRR